MLQCTTFREKYEDDIEEWYQNNGPESLDHFYSWLCIDTAKVCCPEGTFGKNCRRCHYGDNGRICSGNGVCNVSDSLNLFSPFVQSKSKTLLSMNRVMVLELVMVDVYAKSNLVEQIVPIVNRVIQNPLIKTIKWFVQVTNDPSP